MSASRDSRPVYSTESGRLCSKCGQPLDGCACGASDGEWVPESITARLAIEKAGRRGKTVTVIYGLPRNPAFLKRLAQELKKACGGGGTAYDDRVEIQGDHLVTLRSRLQSKGWTVKG
ncbi:MAG: stress response translation initiation inhibitor YciH [Thermoanaerobaculia bacterium]|nr:stress response translation initiation inhibitor YciH [Thermoanaerobaculia bacterium]